MHERLRTWLENLPYHDSVVRRQAALLQGLELGLFGFAFAFFPIVFFAVADAVAQMMTFGLLGAILGVGGGALILLRRGAAQASALTAALGLTLILAVLLYGVTFTRGAVVLFTFSLPIAIGGLLLGRNALLLVLAVTILAVGTVIWLESLAAPGSGFIVLGEQATVLTWISFGLVAALLGLVIDRISRLGREALAAQRMRERELETLSRRLEAQVRERTADLEMALGTLEVRAAEQEQLLAANRAQAAAIRALSVPILPVAAHTLVMPLVGDLDDERLHQAQQQALERIEQSDARRLILDVTGVSIVDTAVARGLVRTIAAARLLGADVVLVGVRPDVAEAMVSLGVDLGPLRTFADLRTALA